MRKTGPIVVAGDSGMLGRAWCEHLEAQGRGFLALGRDALDIAAPASVRAAIPDDTAAVVNCAAYTDVDGCETDEAGAMRLNRDGVRLLAQRCKDIHATLVHYSTDYVFPGHATRPYPADEPTDPVNAYGRSKAAGERAVLGVGCDHRLIRTSWLYAPWGKNFVRTIAKLAQERDELSVVNDQHGRPTSATGLAETSLALLDRAPTGIYHATDGGQCTWFDLATRVAAHANPACRVTPCTSDAFPRPAKRPAYSVLDLTNTETVLGPTPAWQQRLDETLARLEPETPAATGQPVIKPGLVPPAPRSSAPAPSKPQQA